MLISEIILMFLNDKKLAKISQEFQTFVTTRVDTFKLFGLVLG